MNIEQLAEGVKKIAYHAGEAILNIYNNAGDFGVEQKADQSPLTIADRASNEIICRGLEKLDSQYPIISEENREIPFEERRDYSYYWLVDPLDGTKEFIKRNGEFTVNIALVHRQRPVLGVVFAPFPAEMYWAVKGEGAFFSENGEGTRIKASAFRITDPGLNVVCSRSHLNEATKAFIDRLDKPQLVAKGSSLKFLIMAKGEAHIYPRLGPTMEWDTAAAQIVLEEAGGRIIDEESKQPLLYNKKKLLNPYFIAYGRLLE